MFKKSMRKHIFKTSNIFLKKERSKHVRVLAVYNTQENISFIYIYVTWRRKVCILNARLIIFYIKKTQKRKKNIRLSDFAFPGCCSIELNFTSTVTNAN